MNGHQSTSLRLGALALGAVLWMLPGSARAFFSAPLVQCQAVSAPATLPACGTDPLNAGVASIDDEGDLEISISGAATNATYSATLVGPDGTIKTLPNLSTGGQGNGLLRHAVFFPLGKVGAGNIYLSRSGDTQFVTGIAIEKSGGVHALADFRPELVQCSAVSIPGAITGCGTDAFKNGQVQFDSVDGDVNIQVEGAAAGVTYAAVLRVGATDLPLCTLGPTTSKGAGQCTASEVFPAGTIAYGTVVLTRDGADQAYSGFRVSLKPRPKPATTSGLVPCLSATFGSPSTSLCGGDPLTSGSAVLGNKGVLNVLLVGAAPDTSYEVFFRPINSDGSTDVDTGVAVSTDDSGDGKSSGTLAPAGTVGSGVFVVKQGDSDEFLSGFTLK